MYDICVHMITPETSRLVANTALDVAGFGPKNFGVALSADGSSPATHYGCSWRMTNEEWAKVQTALVSLPIRLYPCSDLNGSGPTFAEVLTQETLKLVQKDLIAPIKEIS